MKIDFSISELELIFENLKSVSLFKILKEEEFRENNINLNEYDLNEIVYEYRNLKNKIFKAISDKEGD